MEVGPTDELLDALRHPYTGALLSVVPETRQLEEQILKGEIPDPRMISAGCRFHPRCPLLQSGEAERLGIVGRCRDDDPEIIAATDTRAAACWATPPGF
ncbi:MAG: oligopeptide/dipeptide ABC transporter ATP-binding protein [Acidimicrobiia bacterium]